MQVTSNRAGKAVVINIDGELNINTAAQFHDALFALIKEGQKYFVIDCVLLTEISSAGLRIFYQALNELEKVNGKIVVCRVNEMIRQVFHMVNLTSEVPLYTTVDEAVKAIEKMAVS